MCQPKINVKIHSQHNIPHYIAMKFNNNHKIALPMYAAQKVSKGEVPPKQI